MASTIKTLRRLIPLFILLLGVIVFFALDGASYLNMDVLRTNQQLLQETVDRYGILAQLGYMLLYILATAFSLPIGALLTITAGFLFGWLTGTVIVVIGATIGAIIIFSAVKMGLGDFLTRNADSWVARMREGFNKNAFSYLLMLRLIPIFPFALVNVVPALLGVSLMVYATATLIGIIPGSLVYVLLGNGLGAIFAAGGSANLGLIFTPQVLIPILALAGLVAIQLIYRKLRSHMETNTPSDKATAAKSTAPKPTSRSKPKPKQQSKQQPKRQSNRRRSTATKR